MPRKGYRSITVREETYVRFRGYCRRHSHNHKGSFNQMLAEMQATERLFTKIIKAPKKVERYT